LSCNICFEFNIIDNDLVVFLGDVYKT
jgi:hypothetical protein